MAESVSTHIRTTLTPGKAGPVATYPIGTRVTGINETTRLAIEKAIQAAIDAGDDILTVADAIEGVGLGYLFDEYRAEMIARTELMDAYNGAALSSYGEAGVTEVQAIDGDGDEECAARDGAVMSVEEADGIEDHPNGTLDWAPVIGDEPAKADLRDSLIERQFEELRAWRETSETMAVAFGQKATYTNVYPAEVITPPVTIQMDAQPAPVVNVTLPNQTVTRRVERDDSGRIVAVHEEMQ